MDLDLRTRLQMKPSLLNRMQGNKCSRCQLVHFDPDSESPTSAQLFKPTLKERLAEVEPSPDSSQSLILGIGPMKPRNAHSRVASTKWNKSTRANFDAAEDQAHPTPDLLWRMTPNDYGPLNRHSRSLRPLRRNKDGPTRAATARRTDGVKKTEESRAEAETRRG
jgi:uncharacterized Zn-finger protein